MSAELFDYIHSVKPSLSDEKRATVGQLIMHYITLARVSDGRVRIDKVLTASGKPFARKVLATMPLVRTLAFALQVDMTCPYAEGSIPQRFRRLCQHYDIDFEACAARHKKLEHARAEMWDLIIFVRVALAVMAALHEESLQEMDEIYSGHRPADYKPRSKWLGLGVDHPTAPVRARDLPRAKLPRAVGAGISASSFGPTLMVKQASDNLSLSSASSSLKSGAYRRPAVPHSTVTQLVPRSHSRRRA